ncbi:hypothetical protein N7466_000648 [Penicillium verhagenii]|uniref:uncharacterized protein n=1 Tax=Penicillium verhagenii TaxID=1562060 RepID=UPI0025450DF6|nr:uncharacterized protein N7466_000648 [Penicillium verhagenii]KAJ5947633.1 hypothetical protein N7466_000648 [Penicillium verhagenii]
MSQLDNLQNRDLAEEIEAINAIYEPDTIALDRAAASSIANNTIDLGSAGSSNDDAQTTITLQLPGQPHLSFIIGFGATYPETRPTILGTASTAARGEGKIAVDVLEDIVQRTWQPGAVCLFDIISEAVDVFPELNIGGGKDSEQTADGLSASQTTTKADDPAAPITQTAESFGTLSLKDAFGLDSPPDWIMSDVVTEKKSTFLARAARVTSLAQAQAYLDHLTATDKKVAVASHNISAWRIKQKKNTSPGSDAAETQIQDYDDDGETAAGGRLLHVMQLMNVWNVVVVVSRWFGGIHLGPARFRLINDVGRDALVKGGFVREETPGPEKGKKKGKK